MRLKDNSNREQEEGAVGLKTMHTTKCNKK